MEKLDVRDMIYNKLKLNEVFAKKMSELLDKPYEEVLSAIEEKIDKKIDEAEKTFYTVGQESKIDINKIKSEKNFFDESKTIKG